MVLEYVDIGLKAELFGGDELSIDKEIYLSRTSSDMTMMRDEWELSYCIRFES